MRKTAIPEEFKELGVPIHFELREYWGVPLLVPMCMDDDLILSEGSFDKCRRYCGAGDGLGELVVPETILGLKISIACKIHDFSFNIALPTWPDFHYGNSAFRSNINTIIQYQSANWFIEHLRYHAVTFYFNSVDTLGAYAFWALKEDQLRKIGRHDLIPILRRYRHA